MPKYFFKAVFAVLYLLFAVCGFVTGHAYYGDVRSFSLVPGHVPFLLVAMMGGVFVGHLVDSPARQSPSGVHR